MTYYVSSGMLNPAHLLTHSKTFQINTWPKQHSTTYVSVDIVVQSHFACTGTLQR